MRFEKLNEVALDWCIFFFIIFYKTYHDLISTRTRQDFFRYIELSLQQFSWVKEAWKIRLHVSNQELNLSRQSLIYSLASFIKVNLSCYMMLSESLSALKLPQCGIYPFLCGIRQVFCVNGSSWETISYDLIEIVHQNECLSQSDLNKWTSRVNIKISILLRSKHTQLRRLFSLMSCFIC